MKNPNPSAFLPLHPSSFILGLMIIVPPIPFLRRRSRRAAVQPGPPPPVALTLVSATYQTFDDPFLTLTFDRAIDIAGFEGSGILVDDGQFRMTLFDALGALTLEDPQTLRIELTTVGPSTAAGEVLLTAGANNGIVAVDDGGTWAGVSNLALPFP
jgi:hypothetical protein